MVRRERPSPTISRSEDKEAAAMAAAGGARRRWEVGGGEREWWKALAMYVSEFGWGRRTTLSE